MKDFHSVILSAKARWGQARKLGVVLTIGLAQAACQNYTTAPVCNDANATRLSGVTGTYEISVQDSQTFEVTTHEIAVNGDETGFLSLDGLNGKTEESRLCQVNGWILSESSDPNGLGYKLDRVFVTGLGISFKPVFFDKASLDSAGVPSKIVEMPEFLPQGLLLAAAGKIQKLLPGHSEESLGLVVDNSGVPSSELIDHAHTSSIGFSLIRK